MDEDRPFWIRVYCYSTGTEIYFDAYAVCDGSSHARECTDLVPAHRSNDIANPPFLVLCRAPRELGIIGTRLLGVQVI